MTHHHASHFLVSLFDLENPDHHNHWVDFSTLQVGEVSILIMILCLNDFLILISSMFIYVFAKYDFVDFGKFGIVIHACRTWFLNVLMTLRSIPCLASQTTLYHLPGDASVSSTHIYYFLLCSHHSQFKRQFYFEF